MVLAKTFTIDALSLSLGPPQVRNSGREQRRIITNPKPMDSGFQNSTPLAMRRAGREEEILARNDDEVTTPDAEDVPFDPWENDEDESDRRRDPLRQPAAQREAVEGEEEPAI